MPHDDHTSDLTSAIPAVPTPANAAARPGPSAPMPGQIGPYKVLSLLGEGGFGMVYLAEQTEPVRRRVALKVIKPGMDSRSVLARFDAERQALALMDHPGVAKVLDAGSTDRGLPYFVMEHVAGVPISEYCDMNRLDLSQRLDLFLQVCDAVQHAHQKGIIHRDLKPSNILVTVLDGKPHPKVIDFGIAKALHQRLTERTVFTEHGQLIGTPEYMSPEQAEMSALDVDTRTDVYSLGVLLYELLTGTQPFSSRDLRTAGFAQIQKIIREVEPPKPSTRLLSLSAGRPSTDAGDPAPGDSAELIATRRGLAPASLARQIRGDLDWIVMKALEKDRNRRYSSASEFAADIQRHLRDEPVAAGPPSAAYRVSKFVRRHRAGVATAATLLLLLVGSLAGMTTLYGRAEAQRARAETEVTRTKAVTDFLIQMLQSADPTVALGREITVRELLDDAATKAEALQNQPETEGAIRDALGRTYWSLGRYEQAERQLARAVDLRTSTLGAAARETLGTLDALGTAQLYQGKLDEAETVLRRAVEAKTTALGGEDPDTLASMAHLALVLHDKGDWDGAEALHRRVIEIKRRTLGAETRDTVESLCSFADMLEDAGKLEEAETFAREAAETAARAFGDGDVLTLTSRSILAAILDSRGRTADAEPILRSVLEAKTRIYGAEHRETLITANALAMALSSLNKMEEAETLTREVYERARRSLGPEHPETLSYMNNLGQFYRHTNQPALAAPLLKEAYETTARINGTDDRDALISAANYGLALLDMGDAPAAEPILRSTLDGFLRTLPADHWMIPSMRSLVGRCERALKRYEDAERTQLAALAEVTRILGPEHGRVDHVEEELMKLYDAWGKPEEAAKWRAKLPEHYIINPG